MTITGSFLFYFKGFRNTESRETSTSGLRARRASGTGRSLCGGLQGSSPCTSFLRGALEGLPRVGTVQ